MNRMPCCIPLPLSTTVLGGLLFASAGRIDLPMFWVYLGVYWGSSLAAAFSTDAALDTERRHPADEGVDPVSRPSASLLFLSTVVVAALDVGRFHWGDSIHWVVQFTAIVLLVLALAVQVWAMATNAFFSTAIRIQSERGQRLINNGPYRFIRHPGYLAMGIMMPATALALGSLTALIPAFCYSALILWRAINEDQFLVWCP